MQEIIINGRVLNSTSYRFDTRNNTIVLTTFSRDDAYFIEQTSKVGKMNMSLDDGKFIMDTKLISVEVGQTKKDFTMSLNAIYKGEL